MESLINVVALPAALLAALLVPGCPADSPAAAAEPPKPKDTVRISLTPAGTEALLAETNAAKILDVRTAEEFAMGHIEGAINLNVLDEPEFKKGLAALDKDATYIVHCAKNPAQGRSSRAIAALEKAGFTKAVSLEGGYFGWTAAGKPVVKSQGGPEADQTP